MTDTELLTDAEIRTIIVSSPTPEEWARFPVHFYWVNVHLCRAQRQKMVDANWKSPEVWEQIRDAAVFLARADERKAIGKWMNETQNWTEREEGEGWCKVWQSDVDALLKGERPNGQT